MFTILKTFRIILELIQLIQIEIYIINKFTIKSIYNPSRNLRVVDGK